MQGKLNGWNGNNANEATTRDEKLTMKSRMSNATQQFVEFFSRVVCWLWDTLEKLLDIFLDFLGRIVELILAVMNLLFQVICFLRDLCIESMQTFANVFRGIVNIVRNISCEEIEDFASACIVVLLWVAVFRLTKNVFQVGIFPEFYIALDVLILN